MTTPAPLFYDDLAIGQIFKSGSVTLDADRIKAYAKEYDPQPFHLDDAAARNSLFQGLAASGWQTASLTMRLLVEGGLPLAGGIIGAGAQVSWPRPLRPGDTIRTESEIVEMRPSRSKPDRGSVKTRTTTLNQHGEPVQVLLADLVVPRRPA